MKSKKKVRSDKLPSNALILISYAQAAYYDTTAAKYCNLTINGVEREATGEAADRLLLSLLESVADGKNKKSSSKTVDISINRRNRLARRPVKSRSKARKRKA